MSLMDGLPTSSQFVFLLVMVAVSEVNSEVPTDVYVPKVSGTMKSVIVCQGKERNLTCTNKSMVLVINKASYGRSERGNVVCPYNKLYGEDDKNDQKTGCEQNVRKKVKSICNKRKRCQLSAKKKDFGRPCPGIYKYLDVVYVCGFPVYVSRNVTKSNVTKPNNTQSNTILPPTASNTSTTANASTTTAKKTMRPANSSCTTTKPTTKQMTSPLPFLPSSTVIKTVDNLKQPSTSTVNLHYSTGTMGQQSNAFRLSTAGRLFIWFLHFRDNSSSYIAVFVITAVCAAIIVGGVFGRCWYLRRRTKSQKFAVLHKPKRFFEPPRQFKHSNGYVSRRTSRDVNMNDDVLAERPLNKTTEQVLTRADIESTQRQKPHSQGLTVNEEGDGLKGDNSTFYVNPMYDRNRQNSTASGGSTTGSHPRIQGPPHRLSNASDGKIAVLGSPARSVGKQQMRCNSMGNIPRSSQAGIQRRHPSAGNVASNKDMYQYQQQQNFLYNAPQIKGNYQGQQRSPINQPPGVHSPVRQGVGPHPNKNPINQRPNGPQHGSPTKSPQRNRPMGPGSATYPSPGHPGRRVNRPNSPYEYGKTEKDPNFSGSTDGQRYRVNLDQNSGQHYHGNGPGEVSQRGVNSYGDIGITVNPAASQSPMHYRSNGTNPPREGWGSSANTMDSRLDPAGQQDDQTGNPSGYGKGRSKPPVDNLRRPDGDQRFVGGPNSESNNFRPKTYEGARPQVHYPAPPDQGSDSSEDDLYSIVAKGNYDSVVNDPLNVHQTFKADEKKHRNNAASRTSSRMLNGRNTSV